MYHRFEHRLASDSRAHYLDNLELADETLGEVRHAMETAGVWDDSIVLITGDHGFRPFIWKNLVDWDAEDSQAGALVTRNRVPFLVKMPRQVDAITYDDHFNTILVRDLFTAMMNGEVHTASQVGSWIHTWGSAHGLDKETQNRGAHLPLH
jgi:arylsulfatase A-like enzyme